MSVPAVTTRPRVVVVGGGIAGLTAALEVLDALPAADVTVLEGSDRLGGKLRREAVAGHVVDVGAESMLALRPEAVDLAARVGAEGDLVTPATTAASVWTRGALRPLPRATLMGVPSDPESARGILTDDEVERLRDEQPWPGGPLTTDVSVGDYVGARLGPAVVDRLVEPLLGGVYAGHAARLSLQATMPVLWQRATRGESLVDPGRAGTPGTAPASRPAAPTVRRPAWRSRAAVRARRRRGGAPRRDAAHRGRRARAAAHRARLAARRRLRREPRGGRGGRRGRVRPGGPRVSAARRARVGGLARPWPVSRPPPARS